jgi:hypothetical protein
LSVTATTFPFLLALLADSLFRRESVLRFTAMSSTDASLFTLLVFLNPLRLVCFRLIVCAFRVVGDLLQLLFMFVDVW